MKTTSKCYLRCFKSDFHGVKIKLAYSASRLKPEDAVKNENEDDLRIEDNLKNEDGPKNYDNLEDNNQLQKRKLCSFQVSA